jgi:tetratricopeptide (TPR) repeat protein
MIRLAISVLLVATAASASASGSWFWPFGSQSDEKRPPRLSELMRGASTNIDAAVDFADEGKINEAIESYRRALTELNRVEQENPERAQLPEFATLRNKRAYVTAAIDSLLLSQVKSTAKVVAVSDTSEIEKKFEAEKKREKDSASPTKTKSAADTEKEKEKEAPNSPAKISPTTVNAESTPKNSAPKAAQTPRSLRDQVIADIEKGDWSAAELGINQILSAKPNDAVALNLKAALAAERGLLKEAEKALDQAIISNPRSPFAYYNMADLMMKIDPPNRNAAKRYYETGRAMGGSRDERLEALIK